MCFFPLACLTCAQFFPSVPIPIPLFPTRAAAKRLNTTVKIATQKLERLKIENDLATQALGIAKTAEPAKADQLAVIAAEGAQGLSCVQKVQNATKALYACQAANNEGQAFCTACSEKRSALGAVVKECTNSANFDPQQVLEVQEKWSKACSCDKNLCVKPAVKCAGLAGVKITHKAKGTADDCCDKFECLPGTPTPGLPAPASTPVDDQDLQDAMKEFQECTIKAKGNKDALVRFESARSGSEFSVGRWLFGRWGGVAILFFWFCSSTFYR